MIAPLFKKLSSYLLCTVFIALQVGYSQTVQDFTVTDTDGVTHSLYADYLDEGKTVVIKIFWAGCPPCNAIAKDVQALYVKWGEGAGDVEFIELGDKSFEGDQNVKDYKARHGITFVSVSPDGNSIEALEQFNYSGTPTFIVAAPDRSMIFDPVGIDEVDEAIAATVSPVVPDCPTTGIMITSEADLENYRGLYPACTDLAGDITISGSVSDLRGLETIKTVQGSIEISSNTLTDLSDLAGIEIISQKLTIKDCSELTSLSGLEKLNNMSSSIELTNLAKLGSLDGLKNLQRIGTDLVINNCSTLEDIGGLENLRTIGGNLVVSNNTNLRSFAGLETLRNVDSKLQISENNSLTSITALTSLTLLSSLDIINNPVLSNCAVQSICNLIDADLDIPTDISGNATGCETADAISIACAPAELPTSFGIQILDAFDNPVAGVSLRVKDNDGVTTSLGTSDPDGLFNIDLPNANIPDLDNLVLEYEEPVNSSISGVSITDLILIQNHILGTRKISNPYLVLGADANGNGTVSITDLTIIINAIIGRRSSFADGKIYRIVNEDCVNSESNCANTPLIKDPGKLRQIKLRAIRIADING